MPVFLMMMIFHRITPVFYEWTYYIILANKYLSGNTTHHLNNSKLFKKGVMLLVNIPDYFLKRPNQTFISLYLRYFQVLHLKVQLCLL